VPRERRARPVLPAFVQRRSSPVGGHAALGGDPAVDLVGARVGRGDAAFELGEDLLMAQVHLQLPSVVWVGGGAGGGASRGFPLAAALQVRGDAGGQVGGMAGGRGLGEVTVVAHR
jgi:hypothetical protein